MSRTYKLWLFILVVFAYAVCAWLLATSQIDSRHGDLASSSQMRVNLSAERISGFLNEPALYLKAMATESLVVDSLDQPEQKLQQLTANLLALAGRHPSFAQVRWIDEQGMERIRIQRVLDQPMLIAQSHLQDKCRVIIFRKR